MKKIIFTVLFIFFAILILFFALGKTEVKFNKDGKENSYHESDFYKIYNSDKLIVVDLWASWCEPCIESFPELDSLSKQFESKNVQFLTLSIDKDSLKCKKVISENDFLKSHDITLSHYTSRDSIYSNIDFIDFYVKSSFFKVSSQQIPYIAMIKNKKVIFKSDSDDLNKDELTKILQENR